MNLSTWTILMNSFTAIYCFYHILKTTSLKHALAMWVLLGFACFLITVNLPAFINILKGTK